MSLVKQIASAPRRSSQRWELFQRMHERLDSAELSSPQIQRWRQRWQQTVEQANEDKVLFNRELFFAVQPRERLVSLIERYRQQFA